MNGKCHNCSKDIDTREAYPIEGVDPIDMGEFGGFIVIGHLCEQCFDTSGCECETGCYECQMSPEDYI